MAGLSLRQLLSISDEDIDRERRRREAEARILVRYFAGDGRHGAAPLPVLDFHRDPARDRILIGGNKSGKTVAGCVDVALQCVGRHPYRRHLRPPLAVRVVAPELPTTSERAHPQRDTFREWVPESWLRGGRWEDAWSDGGRTLHFACVRCRGTGREGRGRCALCGGSGEGSFVEFYSSQQDPATHAGERRHLVWFDEEMPRAIFAENLARLARALQLGEWIFTYVPVEGLAWIEDELYRPALESRLEGTGLHQVTIWDNRHNLPEGFIERFVQGLGNEADVLVRAHGAYGVREGRVYATFGPEHAIQGDLEVRVG